jgi:two-component system OmpR family response regulator
VKDEIPSESGLTAILLVEDEMGLAEEIRAALSDRQRCVRVAETFEQGLTEARKRQTAAIVIDRMLHGRDGLALIEAIRQEGDTTPVLVISALSSVDDRIRGLKAGGDDYLVKPFALSELVARVEALLRRGETARGARLRVGALEVDFVERKVWRDGEAIDLLPREFKLLAYFMRRPGQLVTREMLLEDVWNYKFKPQTNVVDVHIGNLRRKLDRGDGRRFIANLRSEGFRLDAAS